MRGKIQTIGRKWERKEEYFVKLKQKDKKKGKY